MIALSRFVASRIVAAASRASSWIVVAVDDTCGNRAVPDGTPFTASVVPESHSRRCVGSALPPVRTESKDLARAHQTAARVADVRADGCGSWRIGGRTSVDRGSFMDTAGVSMNDDRAVSMSTRESCDR